MQTRVRYKYWMLAVELVCAHMEENIDREIVHNRSVRVDFPLWWCVKINKRLLYKIYVIK